MTKENTEAITRLVETLKRCPAISRLSTDSKSEPEALAHAVADIGSTAEKMQTEIIPKLLSSPGAPEVEDLLHQLREELRHVLYHIKDTEYFSVLL